MPSIHLTWNPKHVIVQWVDIRTHTLSFRPAVSMGEAPKLCTVHESRVEAAVSMGEAPKLCTVHESRVEVKGSTGISTVA